MKAFQGDGQTDWTAAEATAHYGPITLALNASNFISPEEWTIYSNDSRPAREAALRTIMAHMTATELQPVVDQTKWCHMAYVSRIDPERCDLIGTGWGVKNSEDLPENVTDTTKDAETFESGRNAWDAWFEFSESEVTNFVQAEAAQQLVVLADRRRRR